MLRYLCCLCLTAATVFAQVLEFDLKAGRPRTVMLESTVDDEMLRDPRGYTGHGLATQRFTQRIELENTGNGPLQLRALRVNGRPYTSADSFRRALGLAEGAEAAERLFSFWRDARSHAGSGSPLAVEPFAALNFWGFTLCGEDTQAFARLGRLYGLEARQVALVGHVAGEYRTGERWSFIDGDQNAVYLQWDNQTLASAGEVQADPLLILRTKAFGRHSPESIAASAFNSSLLEHVAPPAEPRPIKLKQDPAPLNSFILQPGETLIWHATMPPDPLIGQINTEKPTLLRDTALATIEHRLKLPYHAKKDGAITVHEPFPITRVVQGNSSRNTVTEKEAVVFKTSIPVAQENEPISILMQCSRNAIPFLSRHDNTVLLDATDGKARIHYHYEPMPAVKAPQCVVAPIKEDSRFYGTLTFALSVTPEADKVWWQVAQSRDFAFVPPSLDQVSAPITALRFTAFQETFLSPGRVYFLRAKARSKGVWGAWSDAVPFRVNKPVQPGTIQFSASANGKVRLIWAGSAEEFLVFGSNRRDFIPEPFTTDEIVAMEHLKVTQTRPNKNLLGVTKEAVFEFEPQHRYYRVIARNASTLSVPGPLGELPATLKKDLPQGLILQSRVLQENGQSRYEARERKLP